MIEGLWTLEFRSNVGVLGAGVVILTQGKIFGGDSSYFYVGEYRVTGSDVRATVRVTHYAGPPSSIFGPLDNFTIEAQGQLGEPTMGLQGRLVEAQNRQVSAVCTKRAPL